MSWFLEAVKLKEEGLTQSEISLKLGVKKGTVASRFSRANKKNLLSEAVTVEPLPEKEVVVTTAEELKAILLKELKKPKTIDELVAKTPEDIDATRIEQTLNALSDSGHSIDNIKGRLSLRTTVHESGTNEVHLNWNGDRIIKFGVVSDMHLNSKYQQLTHLNAIYDMFAAEGITDVYNPGDILEGEYQTRKGHAYEIFNHGADDQVDYAIANYPRREGITTHFITGNHDHTHLKNAGYDIGKPIGRARDDMNYLGINNATIFLTPKCRMDIAHPLDGSSYALSYSLQKSIEAMPMDDLPHIYIVGHHHKAIYVYNRGIHAMEAGTFQAQTGWMRGKRLAAHVGGWIVTVHVNEDGDVTRFNPEWIPFPKTIKNDY